MHTATTSAPAARDFFRFKVYRADRLGLPVGPPVACYEDRATARNKGALLAFLNAGQKFVIIDTHAAGAQF